MRIWRNAAFWVVMVNGGLTYEGRTTSASNGTPNSSATSTEHSAMYTRKQTGTIITAFTMFHAFRW